MGHATKSGREWLVVVADHAFKLTIKIVSQCEMTHCRRIDTGYNSISFLSFAHRVMVDAELLGNQVHYATLLGRQSPGEGKLVSHGVILEEQDAGVNL